MSEDPIETAIDKAPEAARKKLIEMRKIIRSVVPKEATEKISYQMPSFYYKGGLVCYSAFTNHCSLFPMNSSLIAQYADELEGFETSKGTIRFPLDKKLPVALIKKLVKARVAENEAKKPRK